MTRESKKEHERQMARLFLEGFENAKLEDHEGPDFFVRWPDGGDFALEVTEYHSQTQEGETGATRLGAELAWSLHVAPSIDPLRQAIPTLKNVQAIFRFNDAHLPRRSEGQTVARDLVGAIDAAVADRRFTGM